MDHKTWLWRKKSSEKTIVAMDKVDVPSKPIEEEIHMLSMEEKVGPERPMKNLNEKLASVLFDCHAKDDLVTEHSKMAQEAVAGWEKAETEAAFLKQELDEALRWGVTANERLTHSDAALKECKQKLSSFQEKQEQRIHNAVIKVSREFEEVQKQLEEKLAETSKSFANLAIENGHLSKALLVKEKVIEDMQKHKFQADAESNALMARLDSTEKENAFLKYEYHMLEKELEIRNEELEYNRQSADASRKQHLESVKKITKLEAECQRLRILMRKRLPGPAALAKMKSEVEMLGRNQRELPRIKMNPTKDLIVRDATMEKSPEIPTKKISFLIEQLHSVEEENKTLKEIITKKNTELHSSRIVCIRMASRLSKVEPQLGELSKGQKSMELARCSPMSNELSLTSGHDFGSDDGDSSSGSWANALISELEHFRNEKLKNLPESKAIEVPEMSLMNDFVEMEKLAIVSTDTACGTGCQPELTGKELISVVQYHNGNSDTKQEIQSRDVATERSFDWLQIVLNAILEQKRVSKRSLDELLEDIRIALGCINHPGSEADAIAIPRLESDPLHISGYITWKSPNRSQIVDSHSGASSIDTSVENNQHNQSSLSKSIHKIIELIQGINPTLPNSATSDFFVRVFQWKSSELNAVLQRFVHTCNDLLNGKADLEKFAEELTFALDWIINNYIASKNASSVRNKIKKHFGWNESEVAVGTDGLFVESDIVHSSRGQANLQEENRRLKDELKTMESAKKDMEARLQSATDKSESLTIQLQESDQSKGSLQSELEALKELKGVIEDQIENQKLINEDLDTQLTVAKAKLNEVFQKFSSLEVELEDKSNCCEELEATCLELQLQLESVTKMETPKYGINQEEKRSQTGWEITAASVKLAECQETILNLSKQLKALASPRQVAVCNKVFSTTGTTTTASHNKNLCKRSSLRDRMLAEDGADIEVLKSPKIKEIISTVDAQKHSLVHSGINALSAPNFGSRHEISAPAVRALAIVPSKKQGGGGFLRKLLLRRKKGSSKKSKSLAKV